MCYEIYLMIIYYGEVNLLMKWSMMMFLVIYRNWRVWFVLKLMMLMGVVRLLLNWMCSFECVLFIYFFIEWWFVLSCIFVCWIFWLRKLKWFGWVVNYFNWVFSVCFVFCMFWKNFCLFEYNFFLGIVVDVFMVVYVKCCGW